MAKPDLGTKHICVACGARFYDLGKTPAVCPKCHAEQPPEQPRAHRLPGTIVPETRPPKKPAPETRDAELDVEGAAESGDEDVIEDTSDLEDDSSAIGSDIEVGSGEEHDS